MGAGFITFGGIGLLPPGLKKGFSELLPMAGFKFIDNKSNPKINPLLQIRKIIILVDWKAYLDRKLNLYLSYQVEVLQGLTRRATGTAVSS